MNSSAKGYIKVAAVISIKSSSNGVATYQEVLPDGRQAWAEVHNGQITNGGVNNVPK